MNIVCRAGLAAVALAALAACAAPRWENLKHPGADLQADVAACEREAERVAKLDQLARPMAFQNACVGCDAPSQDRAMQTALGAYGVHKRCMAARGWQRAS